MPPPSASLSSLEELLLLEELPLLDDELELELLLLLEVPTLSLPSAASWSARSTAALSWVRRQARTAGRLGTPASPTPH